jgi:hypothetical protein
MVADVPNHEPSLSLMNCGTARQIRPSFGSWVTYGLGTDNQNLPAFVAMCPGGYPIQESQNWQAAFLPGVFQGTYLDTQHTAIEKLIEHIRNDRLPLGPQRQQLDLLQQLNRRHQEARQQDAELEARIQSFELAFRMQTEAADAFDVSREPQHILDLYGPGVQARQILIARRLVERGVRFVQIFMEEHPWDSHVDLAGTHRGACERTDLPVAGLLQDLKQRGLLDSTLVIWGGEFGRTPTTQKSGDVYTGRDHNMQAFSSWMAGGGVRGGTTYGTTDDFGHAAVENPVSVHDFHATILHLLGLHHQQLYFQRSGLHERLTGVEPPRVVEEILS